jgi:phosphotransferase system  glucose/maltose/N-acetylglucosamine-specific IIC component
MLQRIIGLAVGAIVTIVLLVIMVPTDQTWQDYVLPVAIGAVAAFFWPIVIAFWLGRRARARRENQIEAEVQRQLGEERRPPGA